MDDSLNYIIDLIKKNNIKNMLEIGTGIGFSSINIADKTNIQITTIEKDFNNFIKAFFNINKYNQKNNITLINDDACTYNLNNNLKYDLIFIDGPKAHYIELFLKYEKLLNKKGIIICDNVFFHNLNKSEVSKRTKRLIEKLEDFKEFIIDNKNYNTSIVNIGDGLSVSYKK